MGIRSGLVIMCQMCGEKPIRKGAKRYCSDECKKKSRQITEWGRGRCGVTAAQIQVFKDLKKMQDKDTLRAKKVIQGYFGYLPNPYEMDKDMKSGKAIDLIGVVKYAMGR